MSTWLECGNVIKQMFGSVILLQGNMFLFSSIASGQPNAAYVLTASAGLFIPT